MVKTWVRLYELLETLDEAPDGIDPSSPTSTKKLGRDRLRKHELLKACKALDLGVDAGYTMPMMRRKLRESGKLSARYSDKSPNTALPQGEITNLNRAIRAKRRVKAEDYKEFYVKDHDALIVNGEEYDVSGAEVGEVDEAPYDQYHMILLEGDRKRVMILHGLDTDECWYDSDVVLESAGDYGPYKSWRKVDYVRQINKT